MYRKYFQILFLVTLTTIAFSFKHGVTKKGHDKTGSPLSDGKCFNCHKAGKYGVSLEMKIFEDSSEVQNYIPGHRYKLKFHIKHTGNPAKYGFQLTALDKNNKNGGKFENIPSGFALRQLKGVNYIDHTNPGNIEFLNVDWVAPDSNAGDITVYFGGIAANGNGGTSGDGGAVNSFIISDGTSDAIDLDKPVEELFVLKSNISNSYLELDQLKYSKYDYRIISGDGRIIKRASIDKTSSNSAIVDISGLKQGLYFIQVLAHGKSTAKSFVAGFNSY